MPTEKRQRQDEGRLARLEEQRAEARRSQRRRQVRSLAILLAALVVGAALWSFFARGGDDDATDVSSGDTTSTTAAEDDDDDPTVGEGSPVDIVLPEPGASITGETPCPAADGSAERTTSFEQVPSMCIDPSKTYTATLTTTEGDIEIALDVATAPQTVNNFVVLARYGFYEGVAFHRIIPGFMNQAGDPVGPTPGTGGPGYNIADELPDGDDPYPAGALAMANTGQPDSGSSQFFIVVEGGGQQLTPTYSMFGQVTEGQEVVDAINVHGDAATNGTPTKLITITSVEITES